MQSHVYSCTRCGFSASDAGTWGHFRYEDGWDSAPLKQKLGWCYTCESVVGVECLPSPDAVERLGRQVAAMMKPIDEARASLLAKRSWFQRLLKIEPPLPAPLQKQFSAASALASAHSADLQRLRFLEGRTDPPRCLACGGDRTDLLPEVQPPGAFLSVPPPPIPVGWNHPGCGGKLMVAHSGIPMFVRLGSRYYARDGRLRRVEEPGAH